MRALLIEDILPEANAIKLALQSSDILCDIVASGEEACQFARLYEYNIMILDLVLPDMHGLDLLKQLRAAAVNTPILVLSGLQDTEIITKALGLGADDYLRKPFDGSELISRVHAIIRRAKGYADSLFRVGRLTVSMEDRIAYMENTPLHLTKKEFCMLELLALRQGAVITKDMFLNALYGGQDEPELKIIDVFICKIRKKFAKAIGRIGEHYIQTSWGRGYVLRNPEEQYHSSNTGRTSPAFSEDTAMQRSAAASSR